MKRKDLLESLILILTTEDNVEILDEAAFSIANLSKDFGNKAEIRKIGGIQALVKLLDIADPDVKKSSVTNRSEVRYVKGLRPILDLLVSEYPEVQEFGLKCLIKCSEDYTNRGELRKLQIVKRLLDLLSIEANEGQFQLALVALTSALDDTQFTEYNGMPILIKLVSHDDSHIKRQACVAINRAAKSDKNQAIARESGVLQSLCTQLGSLDQSNCVTALIAITSLGKNDLNQAELMKIGVVELLSKHIQSEDKDVRREALGALASFCTNAKVRAKVRLINECLQTIIKQLSTDCTVTTINAVECLIAFSEDLQHRSEAIKAGAISAICQTLDSVDYRVQSVACMALGRLNQEYDGQVAFSKVPKAMNRLVELLGSPDINVCRNATYVISVASQYETNAINACSAGAIDLMVELSKQAAKRSTKFATDALEKLLNTHTSAKYWLVNHLTASNTISDGFYDLGYAGILDRVGALPSLIELKSQLIDKRREIIQVDANLDINLFTIWGVLQDLIVNVSPETQIKMVALAVAKCMGGTGDMSNYKFRISELKLKVGSNVIPIGQIDQGTFYHRALLFKTLCDRLGLKPCTLVRGEYNRAWNIVTVKQQTVHPKLVVKKERVQSSAGKPKSHPASAAVAVTVNPNPVPNPTELKMMFLGTLDVEAEPFNSEESAIVDLMFEPGRLLKIDSPEALAYQRLQ
ncbi:Armadillo repeat-containing protein 3 [Globomyces sp. JEL0801]|nr:Armadillo repeat-containing protein 3 [Globomyces sp. JEL0801]